MTKAAKRFIKEIHVGWTFRDPWEATANYGMLADVDQDELYAICDETGDDYATAEAEVMDYIRDFVATT